jgi:hypothetical protein
MCVRDPADASPEAVAGQRVFVILKQAACFNSAHKL